jgi:alcohol dehydrogenase class IV
MDLAKLVAVLFEGLQKTQDIIGIGKVTGRKVFLVTVSTTAGTGSEVTPIAVLTDTQAKLKKGVVSRYLIPDVAIVDPDLTLSLPAAVTAATGMDAMTHCIEAYTNRFAHPIIDNLAMDGIRLIAANLETCVKNGSDLAARTSMALGSLYGGLCLGPVNTAAVHAMAYPLGGTYKISHGVSNSVLLPFVMAFNLSGNLSKYAAIALAVGAPKGSDDRETAFNGVLRVRELSNACGIPQSLKDLNIPESAIPEMAKAAILVTRLMDNNPRKVELKDAEEIYRKAYHGQIDRD